MDEQARRTLAWRQERQKEKRKLEERNITHFELKLAGREEIQNQSM